MFFYRINVKLSEACANRLAAGIGSNQNMDEYFDNEVLKKFWKETEKYNDNLADKMFFVSEIDEESGVFGFISESEPFETKEADRYLEKIGIEFETVTAREVALAGILQLFQYPDVRHGSRLCDQFHKMVPIEDRYDYREIMEPLTEDSVFADDGDDGQKSVSSRKQFVSTSLREELDRIRSMDVQKEWIGHPVHYLIEADDGEFLDYAAQSIMRALYSRGRITSRKFMGLSVELGSGASYDKIYRFCERGCLLLGIGREDENDSPYASADMGDIILSARWMKKYRNRTLTFYLLPRSCNRIKELLFENTAGCTFVEIAEDTMTGEQARDYLKAQAKNHHVQADERLYENLEEKDYLPIELNKEFEHWLGGHLKRCVFPAYADIACSEAAEAGRGAKGEAYDKLQQMIGLGEAKRVIDEALNYYKAQKMFKDRGLIESHPVMHMVFAGNPGTAKTTVARLFAQIMRDNGLLSEGRLYEVGRADLVGQYVGWTAKQVKAAFKKAKGSVLFIDEAYSLMDDHGLYGDEAINTIVQEMENNSKDMVVILAGYPKEMEELVKWNPGLRSRIAYHVPFADYNEEELYGIAELIADEKGLCLSGEVKEKLMPIFAEARGKEDFGNGRYVRNLVERAQMSQTTRLVQMDVESVTDREVATLRAEDFRPVSLGGGMKKHAIGF